MAIKKYAYREPPTPQGLKAIEKNSLQWFDIEMFSNLNTGVLEQYLEEKNRVESFRMVKWNWKKVFVGIIIGTLFAVVTEYVGLKVGIAVSGGWYIAYLLGLALKWKPNEINIVAGASTGATYISTGFIFTFPAIYLLSSYDKAGEFLMPDGTHLIASIPSLSVALIATILSGFLGVLYFIIFRRIWLVEDPLHVPGFESNVKLLEMSNEISKGSIEKAKHSIKLVAYSTGLIMVFTFFRDFPLYGDLTFMDKYFGGKYYGYGEIIQPYETATYTHISFGLIPIQFGIGWFMKFWVAFLMSLGTLLTWFVIIPIAVSLNAPVYITTIGSGGDVISGYFTVQGASALLGEPSALLVFAKIARVVAIGAILGGGITGLLKMAPAFKSAAADVVKAGKGERRDFVKGKGWYEWPVTHIIIMAVITLIGVTLVFCLGGYPFLESLMFSIVLVATTFFLGAIAVKVMGETGSEPVSGTTFIVLIMLVGLFTALGTPKGTTAVMALLGSTVFGGAISMSGDIIWDFKSGIYCGNRPYHLMKGELSGIVPGAIVSVIGAVIFSIGLATGTLKLVAPQARAFATMTQILVGGQTTTQVIHLLGLGIGIGVFTELLTGMGTAFGLGMYFPLSLTLPQLLGGAARDIWEKKWLEPRAKAENWDEKTKTLKILDTYMVATGLIVGEAVMGTVVAIYLVIPLITGGG